MEEKVRQARLRRMEKEQEEKNAIAKELKKLAVKERRERCKAEKRAAFEKRMEPWNALSMKEKMQVKDEARRVGNAKKKCRKQIANVYKTAKNPEFLPKRPTFS
ncbi:hypothetical protein CF326_g1308 [Tilletia indica]|nr:hypothetical protein CF326_g1308 [Tilletia indica]